MATKYLDYDGLVLYNSSIKNWVATNYAPIALSTASMVVVTDANKKITTSSNITTTELGYLDGVTSNIQTQLGGKAPTSHASTATTYGTASASLYGHAMAGSTIPPVASGTGSVGTDNAKFARADHYHPIPASVNLANTASKLTTARTIDGVSFDGTAGITHYGTCGTAAATQAKTADLTGFTLATGAVATIKFTITNTAASPTLNINSTGAKSIMYRGSAISAGYLAAGRLYTFVYDGTNYELIGDLDTNTTYSGDRGISLVSGKFGHSNTAVTATTNLGGTANVTPGHGETFAVPYLSYDAYGHITGAGTHTVTMPSVSSTAAYTSGTAVYAVSAGSAGTANTATYTSGTAVYATKAGTATDSTKLPLTGGTMTSGIKFSSNWPLSKTNTYGYLEIDGGTGYTSGAFSYVVGKDYTGSDKTAGSFGMVATDSTNWSYFIGRPTGSLTWKGNEVVTEERTSFSFTKASGYTINTQTCYIQNNIVTIYISITTPSSVTSGWHTFATLPSSVKNAVSFDVYWDQPIGSSGNARTCRFTTGDFGIGSYITTADVSKTVHFALTVTG